MNNEYNLDVAIIGEIYPAILPIITQSEAITMTAGNSKWISSQNQYKYLKNLYICEANNL